MYVAIVSQQQPTVRFSLPRYGGRGAQSVRTTSPLASIQLRGREYEVWKCMTLRHTHSTYLETDAVCLSVHVTHHRRYCYVTFQFRLFVPKQPYPIEVCVVAPDYFLPWCANNLYPKRSDSCTFLQFSVPCHMLRYTMA